MWPEMHASATGNGLEQLLACTLRPDGMLIGYLETEDFEKAKHGMAQYEVNAKWQQRDVAAVL